jgi:hypothetical protein
MPGKSRHGKGKHRHQSKKSKAMQRQRTLVATPATPATPVATGTSAAAPPAAAPSARATPPIKTVRATAKTAAIDYTYVIGELKRIGILAGIAIVILFILSIFIS